MMTYPSRMEMAAALRTKMKGKIPKMKVSKKLMDKITYEYSDSKNKLTIKKKIN